MNIGMQFDQEDGEHADVVGVGWSVLYTFEND